MREDHVSLFLSQICSYILTSSICPLISLFTEVLRDKYVQPTGELDDSEDEMDVAGGKPSNKNRENHKDKVIVKDSELPATTNGTAKELNGSGSASMDISESSTAVAGEEPGKAASVNTPTAKATGEEIEAPQELTMKPAEIEPTQPDEPMSPTASGPGLSMNAFGRPKMTAAVMDGGDDMDVDNVDEQRADTPLGL